MGTADVLLALLERDAGVFSVPSKVLSYFCSKRPILAAIPQENLSARIITNEKAGIVVSPDDIDAFCHSSTQLLDDKGLHDQMGENGRNYAESCFNIEEISVQFLEIINKYL